MVDILFVNPPLSWNTSELVNTTCQPPLGILYIISYLQKNTNYKIDFLDVAALKLNLEQVKKYIQKVNPKIVALTAFTINFTKANDIAQIAKSVFKEIITIGGGSHFSAIPEDVLERFQSFDYCVIGEGEVTMLELVNALLKNKSVSKIKGIAFKKGGRIIKTVKRELIKDLDELPYPNRDLLDPEKYIKSLHRALGGSEKAKFTSMISSRGCPFGCVYCDQVVFGKTWRSRSAKNVVDEMEFVVNKYGVKEVVIHDDILTVDRKRIMDICRLIKDRRLDVLWTADARVHTVDYEMLKAMREAGCYAIFFGVESGNQEILNKMNKNVTLDQTRAAVKAAKKAGMVITNSFMIGNLGETEETVNETIKFSKELNSDIAEFNVTVPFPGSQLYSVLKNDNRILVTDWDDYSPHSTKPVFRHENLTPGQIKLLHKKAYREYYMRPSYLISQMKNMQNNLSLYVRGAKMLLKAGFGKLKY